jgi:Fe-S-cluster containining protein
MDADRDSEYSDVGTIFFQDGYQLAKGFIGRGISRIAILQLMGAAYESIDGLIDSFRSRCEREDMRVDCRKGCVYCCSQAVLASNHEILILSHYVDEHVPSKVKKDIKTRTADKHEITRSMNAMEFLRYIHPCPFLEEGSCLIYPVRPMACRCYLSGNLKSCRNQNDNPDDRSAIAELYEFPLRAVRGMNEGIRSALMEAGLIPSEWLLETFMAAVLENPQILKVWLEGNTPFQIRELTPEENKFMREYYDPSGKSPGSNNS